MSNVTLQAPQAFSGVAIDPTTAWTLLVVVAVLSTLVGVVFIVAIVWTCMVCSGRTEVLSHHWCSRRDNYGRNGRFPPTHREMVEMGNIPSTNTRLRHHPAISQDSGVSRGLGLRLSCPPDQVPHVPAPRSWTPSPPYEMTKEHRSSQLGMKSKSQAQLQKVFSNEEGVHFCQSLPVQQTSSCPRCSNVVKPREWGGCSKTPCCTSRSPFNPRQNSPASDAWSRGSIMRSPYEEGGIDNPVFEPSPECIVTSSVQQYHRHHNHHQKQPQQQQQQHVKKDMNGKMDEEHSPQYVSARVSPQLQDQMMHQEMASKLQLGQLLDIPHKPMQRHRSRMFLQPGSAGSNNTRHFVFPDEKKVDMEDTMDILLRHDNQGPVACSSRQTTPQKKFQHQFYDTNVLTDFSASRSDPLVFQRKHYNTPNNSLNESFKDTLETHVHSKFKSISKSPEHKKEVFTDPVARHPKTKAFHPTPYDLKKTPGFRSLSKFKSQQVLRTPYSFQRALSEIQLPPSSEVYSGRVSGQEICVEGQKTQGSAQRNSMPWSAEFGLCMSCGKQGTLPKNLLNVKECATQTSWNNDSTINNTQEMDPTPSMSWDHLTPDPSPVLAAQDQSVEDGENFSQILDDSTQIDGNSSKVFDDVPQNFDTSPQFQANASKGTVNSSRSRTISVQTDPDSSHVPQTSFRRNSTQIQPSISEIRDMSSSVSPMVRGSPFIFVDSRIRVDSPQFVVDSSQLRVESPYHITDTPLSPFSDGKTYGTTSIALHLAHSPLEKKLPIYSSKDRRKSSTSTISENESPNSEVSNSGHQNSGTYLIQPPPHFILHNRRHSHRTGANKKLSLNHPQNNDHRESKVHQRLSPTTSYMQIKSTNKLSPNVYTTTKNKKGSPKQIQTSSPVSVNDISCNTHHCEVESTPEVIIADTLETFFTDDDN